MDFCGKWVFDSIGSFNDKDEFVYLSREEYINAPISSQDEEVRAQELAERKQMTGMFLEVSEDGRIYALMPVPEGVTQEEIDEAVAAGQVTIKDGCIVDSKVMNWEYRDGVPYYDTGIHGTVLGEEADSWTKALDDDGMLVFITSRYRKAE